MTDPGCSPAKPGHGGKRAGAGRKKAGYVAPATVAGVDLKAALAEPPPENVESVASQHARVAVAALAKQLAYGASEPAKISAANAILDRGYGRPTVDVGGEAMLPFMSAPAAATTGVEIRAEARKYARLAVEVLRKIAEGGASENARVAASKSLLDRGLGTVGAAKLPDEFGFRMVGKKEEQAQAARTAATGRYATPAPPLAFAEGVQ